MRIALIHAAGPRDLNQYAGLGTACLAAWISRHAPDCAVACHEEIDALIASRPEVVGISSVTQNFGIATNWAGRIKAELGALVVLGGPHISCLPESLPRDADFGVIGEGEETIVDLLEAFLAGRKDFDQIPGLCFHQGDRVVVTAKRKPISDLERLPMPGAYLSVRRDQGFHLMTSRGCPYRCSFCSAGALWGGFRGHRPERIVEEIAWLHRRHGATRIHLYDDLFIGDRERFFAFVEQYESSGLQRSIFLSAAVRANLVDSSLCEGLLRCGIREVTFGAESQDDRILSEIKPGATAADNERALELLAKFEINVAISMIVGIPGQSANSMRETYRFLARQLLLGRIIGAEVHVLAPFPGTRYYDSLRETGRIGDRVDWSCFGRPWHGLILNDDFPCVANELVGYDRAMRILLNRLKRPSIAVVAGQADGHELALLAGKFPFRAVYGLVDGKSPHVIQRGSTDIAFLPSEGIGDIFRKLPLLPVIVLEQAAEAKACDISGALVRYHGLGGRAIIDHSNLRVIPSDRWQSRTDRALAEMDDRQHRDPLELFSFEKDPEGDFQRVLDDHAEWIRKSDGGCE